MDDRAAAELSPQVGLTGIDCRYLLMLVLLVVGMRTWQLTHTEVTARDSIAYIQFAWNLEHANSWLDVVRHTNQHPAYPAAILAASVPVRHFIHEPAMAMQVSAQLVSAVASVFLVVPLYFLGRELFSRRVAFWGVLVFQCLPSAGRVLADGLTEPLFLLFAATSLLFALMALRRRSVLLFGSVGLASGAAYLTRPEGAFIAAATGLVLLAQQLAPRWRSPLAAMLKCGAALSVGVFVLAVPFMLLIGGLTAKDTPGRVLKNLPADLDHAPWLRPQSEARPVVHSTPFAVLGYWYTSFKILQDEGPEGTDARRWWGLWALGLVLVKGLFFVGIFPVLLGLWLFRDRFRSPGGWLLVLLAVLWGVALYRVAVVAGYLSDRHMLLVTMLACFWGVAGTIAGTRWLAARLARPHLAEAWTVAVLVLFCAGPAVRTLATLHVERAGFREAGYWLAHNVGPDARLVDPYTWASYYAGRVFQPGDAPQQSSPFYVVVEESPNAHTHLDEAIHARELAKTGREVRRWDLKRGKVAIYEVEETNR